MAAASAAIFLCAEAPSLRIFQIIPDKKMAATSAAIFVDESDPRSVGAVLVVVVLAEQSDGENRGGDPGEGQ